MPILSSIRSYNKPTSKNTHIKIKSSIFINRYEINYSIFEPNPTRASQEQAILVKQLKQCEK